MTQDAGRRGGAAHRSAADADGPVTTAPGPDAPIVSTSAVGTALPSGTAPPPVPPPPGDGATPTRRTARGRVLRALAALLLLAVVVAGVVLARHLWLTAQAWEERADLYLGEAQEIGGDLTATRAELAGARSELDAVRAQLATAQARIVELADEKAQLGDDREVQRQLVDYQERVSEAGGRVALALDQCVQGQQQLIGYLEAQVTGTAAYDPAELTAFREDVEALCQAASEANIALQRELSR